MKKARGSVLKATREAAGLSARQLVERAKEGSTEEFQLSIDSIYSYESGRILLSERIGRRLADVLGIPVRQLLVGDPGFSEAGLPRDVLLNVKNFLMDIGIYKDKKVHACILLADLVGSTEFKMYHSERDGLAKVVQHNEVVRECVDSFGGSVVKSIGDGVMAMFEGQQSECRALQAGLETIRQMKVANERQQWQYPLSMDTKIGIHSGPVWMFKYENSPEDPQGTTVDVAAKLLSLAGPNQLLCTKQAYETACQTSGFPRPSAEFKRYLKGIRERFDLMVIVPEGYKYEPPDAEDPSCEVEEKLKKAHRLLHEKKLNEAFKAFQRISDEYPDNYLANVSVAEYLLSKRATTGQEYKDNLCRVEDHIDKAMCSRPNSCHVWLLRASLHFKYFEISRDTVQIEKAIDCTRKAVRLAYDWRNTGGVLQAKVCLIHFLQMLAWERKDSGALDEARKLCIELEPSVGHAFNDCRSDFYVAYAAVQLQSGSTDFQKMEQMIKMAKELSPLNFRVHELELELIKCRYPDGGVAGTFGVSPFEYTM